MRSNSLTPLFRDVKQKLIASVDTEDDSKGHLNMIIFTFKERQYVFKTNEVYIKFLLGDFKKLLRGKPAYVCAVNMEYDLINGFRNYFNLLDIHFSTFKMIKARLHGTNIFFYDLLNHTSISTADMGDYLGLPKMSYDPNSIKYCKRDSMITYKWAMVLQKFYNDMGCEMKATIAASAMDLFRRNHLRYPIKRAQLYRKNIRQSYYGGRTEIFNVSHFKCKRESLYYVDVNSLYPYVMQKELFPNPNVMRHSDTYKEGFEGVIKATVQSSDDNIPILPLKHKGKLLFPNGKFTGVWTIPEFEYAMTNGYKCLQVHYHIVYPFTDDYFSSYVETLYNKRIKSDELFSFFLKIMLNSLYGKFAESNQGFRLVPDLDQGLYLFNGMVIAPYYYTMPASSNIIFSSYITSYARIHLHNLMKKIEEAGALLVYCDTDSIVYQHDKPIFQFGHKLGQLKLEGKYKEGWFKLPKLYMLKNKSESVFRAKGVPMMKSEEFFIEGETTFERPNRLRESIRSGLVPNVWETRTKKMRSQFDKRVIGKNGDTEPLIIEED